MNDDMELDQPSDAVPQTTRPKNIGSFPITSSQHPTSTALSLQTSQHPTSGFIASPPQTLQPLQSSTFVTPNAHTFPGFSQASSAVQVLSTPSTNPNKSSAQIFKPLASSSPFAEKSNSEPMTPPPTRYPRRDEGQKSESDESPTKSPARSLSMADVEVDKMVTSETAEEFSELSKVFSFFSQLTIKQLAETCRAWGRNIGGLKEVRVSRVMLEIIIRNMKGKSVTEILSGRKHLSAYKSFCDRAEICEGLYMHCQSREDFLQKLEPAERKIFERDLRKVELDAQGQRIPGTNTADNPGSSTAADNESSTQTKDRVPQFSLNEFARLFVILRDDDSAKQAALHATNDELSRVELDADVTRESLWSVVEKSFNDPTVQSRLNLVGRVDDVDASALPLAHRSASKLLEVFKEGKKVFHGPKERWSASGKNDPHTFPSFLNPLENKELDADSKKAFIIFTVCRLGTEFVDESILNLVSKTIEGDGGYDEGLPEIDAVTPRQESQSLSERLTPSVPSVPSSSNSRKRRHSEVQDKLAENVAVVGHAVKSIAAAQDRKVELLREQYLFDKQRYEDEQRQQSKAAASANTKQDDDEEAEKQLRMMGYLQQAAQTLKQAEELGIDRFKEVATKHYMEIERKYLQLMKKPRGGDAAGGSEDLPK